MIYSTNERTVISGRADARTQQLIPPTAAMSLADRWPVFTTNNRIRRSPPVGAWLPGTEEA